MWEFNKGVKNNLKILAWIASGISVTGVLLNAYKNIWCWPVWTVANLFWIYYSIKTRQWSQVVLWIFFTLANIYGWYVWILE